MSAGRWAWVSLASFALLAACSEDTSITPLSAWLEWSDSVAAGAPFGVRLRGIGSPADLRITVRVQGDTVTIEPYSVAPPCRDLCLPLVLSGYDTLVSVPGIAATSARTVTIRAPSRSQAVEPPWPLRTFGTVTVSPAVPVAPLTRSVGDGSGFQDSFGCYMVIPGSPFFVYISADQSPDWAPGFTGFVYGRVDPNSSSPCTMSAPVIVVDSIR